jgi:hypothetical protein
MAGEPVLGTLMPSGNAREASTVEAVSMKGMTIAYSLAGRDKPPLFVFFLTCAVYGKEHCILE